MAFGKHIAGGLGGGGGAENLRNCKFRLRLLVDIWQVCWVANVGGITSEGATFFHKLFDDIWLVGWVGGWWGKAGQRGWGEEGGKLGNYFFYKLWLTFG